MSVNRKVVIIGCGNVGSTVAYSLFTNNICDIMLLNHNMIKAYSNSLDIADYSVELSDYSIFSGTYNDIGKDDVIVNCAGNSSMLRTRDRYSEYDNSKRIANDIINNLNKINFNGVFINVMNPCDDVTYLFKDIDISKNHILGTGTLLDSLRLQRIVYDLYNERTSAYIVGKHGSANSIICDNILNRLSAEERTKLLNDVQQRVWCIYEGKGFTNFGIANAVTLIVKSIIQDLKRELCVSTMCLDTYAITDSCLSVPCIINSAGIYKVSFHEPVKHALRQFYIK